MNYCAFESQQLIPTPNNIVYNVPATTWDHGNMCIPASSATPLTTHPTHNHASPHQQDASNNYYAPLVDMEADIADDATVCCSNLAHTADDNSTQATDEEEWTDSDEESASIPPTDCNKLGVVDATSFQYFKRGTRGTSESAVQILQQANSQLDLPRAQTIFNTSKLDRTVEWAFSDSGATGHFLINGAAAVNVRPATNQ